MNTFEQMESKLREAGRMMEVAKINERSLSEDEIVFISAAKFMAETAGLTVEALMTYLDEGAEQARTVLK